MAVVDKDGGFHRLRRHGHHHQRRPHGDATGSATVDEGGTAQLSWAGVTDASAPDAAAGIRYAYDFDNDGTWDVGGATYATASPLAAVDVPAALTADGDDTFTVRAAVIDKDGGLTPYTRDIDVDNVAPTATLTGDAVDEGAPATVAFSAQADPSAADTAAGFTYEYDLDDDGTFEPAGHGHAAGGADRRRPGDARSVHAAIIDRDGGRRVYDTTVTVANVAPTATVTGPDAVPSSGAVSLQVDLGDASADDTLSATIDWGDGTWTRSPAAACGPSRTPTAAAGDYTVTVVTTDSTAQSTPATKTLTVAAAPAAPAPATPGSPVTPAAPKLTIDQLRVSPRCVRAPNLRALVAHKRTVTVRFRLGTGRAREVQPRALDGQARRVEVPAGDRQAQERRAQDPRRLLTAHRPHRERARRGQHGPARRDGPQGQAPAARHVPADRDVGHHHHPHEDLGAGQLSLRRVRLEPATSSRT